MLAAIMLTAFSLENYRAFPEKTTVELRPLTLLFGYNNVGKSSLIRALALMADSARSSGRGVLDLASDAARECDFDDLLSRSSGRQRLRLGLSFEEGEHIEAEIAQDKERRFVSDLRINRETGPSGDPRVVSAQWTPESAYGNAARYDIFVDSYSAGKIALTFTSLAPRVAIHGYVGDQEEKHGEAAQKVFRRAAGLVDAMGQHFQWLGSLRHHPPRYGRYLGEPPPRMGPDGAGAAEILAYDKLDGGALLSEVSAWYEQHFKRRIDVTIEASVFQKSCASKHQAVLVALFMDATRGHHTLEIEPTGNADYLRWVEGEGVATRERCDFALKKSKKLRARRPRVQTLRIADVGAPSWSPIRLSPAEAYNLLRRPLQLLLENARADRNFLRVLTRVADFDLEQLITDGAVKVETNGGIDENRVWIEAHGRTPMEAYRLWVMCDSDAKQPWLDASGHETFAHLGKGAKDLRETCVKHNIPIHILRRRAIDNYVPPKILEQWSFLRQGKRSDLYKHFTRLTNEQRHHYNMKEGFRKDEEKTDHAKNVGCLYHGVDSETFQALAKGFNFGAFGVADLFDESLSHDGMRKLRVEESWLRTDEQEAEARQIAEAIQELL